MESETLLLLAIAPFYTLSVIVLAKMALTMFFTASEIKIAGTLPNGTTVAQLK